MRLFVQPEGKEPEEFTWKFDLGQRVKILNMPSYTDYVVTQHCIIQEVGTEEVMQEFYHIYDAHGNGKFLPVGVLQNAEKTDA